MFIYINLIYLTNYKIITLYICISGSMKVINMNMRGLYCPCTVINSLNTACYTCKLILLMTFC